MKVLLERIERGADRFRNSLGKMLDASAIDDTKAEDNLNHFVKEFEAATDHLKHRFDDDQSAAGDVEEVLRRAARIDGFMTRRGMNSRAQEDWADVAQKPGRACDRLQCFLELGRCKQSPVSIER